MSTDTRDLIARLEKMAAHPMAVMEREWPEVQADLTESARLLREDGERNEGALLDLAATAYADGHWDGCNEGDHFSHDQAKAHFLADPPRDLVDRIRALAHPAAGGEAREREMPTREDRLFALVAREVAHAAGMRPDDPPLEEHLDAAAAIIRRVRDDIASRSGNEADARERVTPEMCTFCGLQIGGPEVLWGIHPDRCPAPAGISTILAAIDAEPELPGEMPDEMWEAIRDDREAATEALRIVVRQTKDGIRERILAALRGEEVGQ